MVVTFNNATIIQAEQLTSAKGNVYGKLRFISQELDVFDLFISGRDSGQLGAFTPKEVCDLSFNLVPGYRGGVELQLI